MDRISSLLPKLFSIIAKTSYGKIVVSGLNRWDYVSRYEHERQSREVRVELPGGVSYLSDVAELIFSRRGPAFTETVVYAVVRNGCQMSGGCECKIGHNDTMRIIADDVVIATFAADHPVQEKQTRELPHKFDLAVGEVSMVHLIQGQWLELHGATR